MKDNNQLDDLIKEIRSLPEPDYEKRFDKQTQDQMYQRLLQYKRDKQTKKKRTSFKPVVYGLAGLATLLVFALLMFPMNEGGKLEINQHAEIMGSDDIVASIKDELEINATKGQVTELLGKADDVVPENSIDDIPDNPEEWRYNITDKDFGNEDNFYQALLTGRLDAQVSIKWSANLFKKVVSNYSIYYAQDNQIFIDHVSMEGVRHYYVTPDGTTKDLDDKNTQQTDNITDFQANITVTLNEMEQFYRDQGLNIQPIEMEDTPVLNGVKANAYQLEEGEIYVHVFDGNEHVDTAFDLAEEEYLTEQSMVRVYQLNNMIIVYKYKPSYSTIEKVNDIKWKISRAFDAMIVASDHRER